MNSYMEKTKDELMRLGFREEDKHNHWILTKEMCNTDSMVVIIDALVYGSYFRLHGFIKSKTGLSYIEICSQTSYEGESVGKAVETVWNVLKESMSKLVLTMMSA